MQNDQILLNDWVLMDELPNKTSGLFTKSSIDWLKRNRHQNGLAQYVRKLNGRLYANVPGFIEWFESHKS